MKLSLNWLQDFIELKEKNPQTLADAITVAVAEVDEVEEQGVLLKNCCVGKILSIAKHPKADRLSLVDVDTDHGTKRVVCGGTNLHEGMYVAFAHTGAMVKWHGGEVVTLEPATIRGEKSDGMICAGEELEIEQLFPPKESDGERPIVELDATDKDIGTSLKEFLGLDDAVLHIDNHAITNRPDLFSHVGFARELVALGLASWKKQKKASPISFANAAIPFETHIDVPKLVPRYCACLLEIDNLGETPEWMKKRLAAVGWRSVSLPVDITNYVTSELGMPMHSFDADDVHGTVHIRTSKKGEYIVTLDKEKRELPDGALVLSDDDGIFDLLGLMGGLRSSTKPTTKRVYLHSAALDPISIRKAIIATGHRTDAGTIYEKGVPPVVVEQGFLRALELFLELVPGAKIVSTKEDIGSDGEAEPIMLDPAHITRLLGVDIPLSTSVSILEHLGFTVEKGKGKNGHLTVTAPLWRMRDCTMPQDIIEEIGRIYGYNDIEPAMPIADVRIPDRDDRVKTLRYALRAEGFTELVPLSFVSANLLSKAGFDPDDAPAVQNPISEELKLLQTSTLPSLLEQATKNVHLAHTHLKTFHCAHVFHGSKKEHLELGLLVTSTTADKEGSASLLESVLLTVKMDLLTALASLGYTPVMTSENPKTDYMHPGRTAAIHVNNMHIGHLFEIHPQIATQFDLPGRAAAVIIDITKLLEQPAEQIIAKPVPQYPAVTYDVTRSMAQTEKTGPLLESLKKVDPLLEQAEIVDLFTGKPLERGIYNLTVRFTYRAPDRTLTENEALSAHQKVLAQFHA